MTTPPLPATTAAMAGSRPGQLVGHQRGALSRDTELRVFAGQRMLVVSAVFVAAALGVRAVVFLLTGGAQLMVNSLAALVLVAAPLLVLLLIPRLVLGRRMGSAALRTTWRASQAISGRLVGAAGAAAPSAATSVAGRVRAAIQRGRVVRPVSVRRFQLRLPAGGPVHCLLRGDIRGADPVDGDALRLTGRRDRAGDFVVRRIEVLGSPSGPVLRVLTPRHTGSTLTTLWWSRVCYAASAVAFSWAVFMLVDAIP